MLTLVQLSSDTGIGRPYNRLHRPETILWRTLANCVIFLRLKDEGTRSVHRRRVSTFEQHPYLSPTVIAVAVVGATAVAAAAVFAAASAADVIVAAFAETTADCHFNRRLPPQPPHLLRVSTATAAVASAVAAAFVAAVVRPHLPPQLCQPLLSMLPQVSPQPPQPVRYHAFWS